MCVLNICKINAYGKNYYLLVLWVWDFEYLLTTYLYHSAYTTFVITIFQWAYNEVGHFGFVPNWSHNFWHKILRTYNKLSMAHTVQKVLQFQDVHGWPTNRTADISAKKPEFLEKFRCGVIPNYSLWDVFIRLGSTSTEYTVANYRENGDGWIDVR